MADEIRQGLPILEFADQAAWQHWLVENHASSGGVWLMIAKKGAPRQTISYGAALDVALAYG